MGHTGLVVYLDELLRWFLDTYGVGMSCVFGCGFFPQRVISQEAGHQCGVHCVAGTVGDYVSKNVFSQ